jgi:Pentapeptide repeats (8 copies)
MLLHVTDEPAVGEAMDGTVGYAATAESASARNLLNAVNSAGEAATTAWLIYLGLAAYFTVALAGVAHKDLLLNTPITLPILGISVALDRFFLFAPPFFILIHIGMMMQYAILMRKAHRFLGLIRREERDMDASAGPVHPLRYELDGNFLIQFLAGPPYASIFAILLQTIVWLTLVMLAAIVLLHFQVAFLAYHDVSLTWAHRLYLLADLTLVGVVGTFLTSPLPRFWASFVHAWRHYAVFMLVTSLFFAGFFAFSVFIATIPGETLDRTLAAIGPSAEVAAPSGNPADARRVFLPTAYLFEGQVHPATAKSRSPFQRNLIVMDEDLVSDRSLAPGDASLSLRYRDLRYARLDRSDLKQADLTCADLTGASLTGTVLTGARRGCDPPAR